MKSRKHVLKKSCSLIRVMSNSTWIHNFTPAFCSEFSRPLMTSPPR
jgi:hypothetical protein